MQVLVQHGQGPSFLPSVSNSQPHFEHLNISELVAWASDGSIGSIVSAGCVRIRSYIEKIGRAHV